MPFPLYRETLFRVILHEFLIANIAIRDVNVVHIAATLALLLGALWLSLHGKPCPTLGAVGRIRKILEMATRTGKVDVEVGTTLLAESRILLVDRSTASTFHDHYPFSCPNPLWERGNSIHVKYTIGNCFATVSSSGVPGLFGEGGCARAKCNRLGKSEKEL
jgi:hypothetical protein